MLLREMKIPGPDHPIAIAPTEGRVIVRFAGKVIADSSNALTLKEASYPGVQYIPRGDVDPSILKKSPTTSWCPYKGEASYYSLSADGSTSNDAIWSYEQPHDAVASIRGYMAFYPNRVESIEVEPA